MFVRCGERKWYLCTGSGGSLMSGDWFTLGSVTLLSTLGFCKGLFVFPNLGDAVLSGSIFGCSDVAKMSASCVSAQSCSSPTKSGVDG